MNVEKLFNFHVIDLNRFSSVYSDDGEHIAFFNPCHLDGAVEIWLSRLLDFHCETIRQCLRVAVSAYEVRHNFERKKTFHHRTVFRTEYEKIGSSIIRPKLF